MAIDIAAGESHLRELQEVRRRIGEYFATQDSAPASWRETILLVDSFYQGRRFESPLGAAVWSPEEKTIAILRGQQVVECLAIETLDEPAPSAMARAA
jgi:hypothetical protein